MSFLGHLHPLLVHLPIGGLVLLGFLELLSSRTRRTEAVQNSRWILLFVAVTSLSAAACGWMLADTGGYDSRLLKWHQATGLAFVGACMTTLLLRYLGRTRIYRVSLVSSLLLLAVTGHLGGSITHGRDFLTRYAPAPVRELLCDPVIGDRTRLSARLAMEQPVFASVIEPILRQRCSECHGQEKHKGDLRLDTLEGLLRGGQDGPVVQAGQANNSPLIQCMVSAGDADGHMPPENQPQPSREEITLIEWWINKGAPKSARIVDLEPTPEIQHLVEGISNRHQLHSRNDF